MDNLLKKTSVGIDIADHTIEVVELSGSKENAKIINIGRTKIPPGIVSRGRVKDPESLQSAINETLKKAKPEPIAERKIIFGLPESQVYTHTFRMENHNRKIIKDTVRREARANIPIPGEDLIFSYKILSEDAASLEIIIMAARKKVVREWLYFFRGMGMEVRIFDIEPLAVFRGLSARFEEQPLCIADLGSATVNLSIFHNDKLRYSYIIFKAGDYITREIANKFSLSFEDAEKRKKEADLSSENQLSRTIKEAFDAIIAEMENVFIYWKQFSEENIREILLVGGTAKINGISAYFTEKLGIKTKTIKDKKAILLYIEAIGLAIRGLDDGLSRHEPFIPMPEDKKPGIIDLYKKKREERKEAAAPKTHDAKFKILTVLLIMVAGAVVLGFSILYKNYLNLRKEVDEKIEEINLYKFSKTFDLPFSIALSEEAGQPDRVTGRLIKQEIKEADSFEVAANYALQDAQDSLEQNERLWPEPVDYPDNLENPAYPVFITWVAFSYSHVEKLFYAKYNLNPEKGIIIDKIDYERMEKTENPNLYQAVVKIQVLGKEPFKQ